MKVWLTSSEIADLALAGLPTTRQNINLLAEREDWARFGALCRKREGRGGGVEYHISLLPVAARWDYCGRHGEAATPPDTALTAQFDAPAGRAGVELDARVAILDAFALFRRQSGVSLTVGVNYFADLYVQGRVDVADWVRQAVPRLSSRTLFRWQSAGKNGEIDRLAVDRGGARRGRGLLDAGDEGRVKAFLLALVVQNPLYTARQLHETLKSKYAGGIELDGTLRPVPSQRLVEMALKRWKAEHNTELLALTNPDAFISRTRVAGTYVHLVHGLNELWQIDASPVDALCLDGRHSVYVCIDVWSRRMVLLVSRTPRSEAVQLLLRKAILLWGRPKAVKTDNGSDFVAKATRRLLAGVNIETITSTAFSPWQKGVVERAVRTFQVDCGRMLPGFIGHNVSDRKVIESRKAFAARLGVDDNKAFAVEMTAAELASHADNWASQIYAHHRHNALGMSPFAKAASWSGPIEQVDAEALNILLMPAPDNDGYRTVGKKGIRIAHYHYMAPGLMVGQRVFVRLDPQDAGRAWCFAEEDSATFIAEARCPELLGEDPVALRAAVAAAQKQLIQERTAEIKAERRKITSRTVLDSRMELAARRNANLVEFPKRADEVTTPALDAGLEVAARRRGDAPKAAPVTDEVAEILAQLEREMDAPVAPEPTPAPGGRVVQLRDTETQAQRYRRFLSIHKRMEAEEPITPAEAAFYGGYVQSAEKKALDDLFDDFGDEALG
ncbi:transposase [Camelimonas fluminis]|uniref:Transposase n=1 Tax=Camelimonas fluminis TaxID=1576911 RepID=A0ABV7UBL1_9HYPH|nr:Mu transposase C-terminal domain-containing protein [Camelimonas fluminis]GHE63812.1 transposase [Camelimonas fluminis]